MKPHVLLLVVMLAAVAVIALLRVLRSGAQGNQSPYKKAEALFSPAERSFHGVLEQALGAEYRVFGKVRVADVVALKSMSNRGHYLRALNRISAKHFDFVVCDAARLSVLCVIELNDKSHQRKKTKTRDAFLSQICSDIGLPLITFPASAAYVIADVRNSLMSAIQAPGIPATTSPAASTVAVNMAHPACPKCSAVMVRRTIKTGSKAGEEFWGCSAFPSCSGVRLER